MKTKFFATAILTITVLFTLTACGNAQNNASSNSPDLTTEQSEKQSSTEYQSENNNSANGQTSNTLGSSEKAESSIDQAGKQNTADKPRPPDAPPPKAKHGKLILKRICSRTTR